MQQCSFLIRGEGRAGPLQLNSPVQIKTLNDELMDALDEALAGRGRMARIVVAPFLKKRKLEFRHE